MVCHRENIKSRGEGAPVGGGRRKDDERKTGRGRGGNKQGKQREEGRTQGTQEQEDKKENRYRQGRRKEG